MPIGRDALCEGTDDLIVGPVLDAILLAGRDVARDRRAPRPLERNTSGAYPRPVPTFARQRRCVAIHAVGDRAGKVSAPRHRILLWRIRDADNWRAKRGECEGVGRPLRQGVAHWR